MRYIKLFEELKDNKEKIIKACEDLKLTNYKVNDDLTVDVDDHVLIENRRFSKLPIMFGTIGGDFIIKSCNNLTTLKGCPKIVYCDFEITSNYMLNEMDYVPYLVSGSFTISHSSKLTTIKYPNKIGGDIILSYLYIESIGDMDKSDCCHGDLKLISLSKLKSLYGIPSEIGDCFDIESCIKLESLEYFPQDIKGSIIISNTAITSLKGCPSEVFDFKIDNNRELRSLEYCPVVIKGFLIIYNTFLNTFKYFPKRIDSGCNIYLRHANGINNFPEKITTQINRLEADGILDFINDMNEYGIWNSDGTFNKGRFEFFKNDFDI